MLVQVNNTPHRVNHGVVSVVVHLPETSARLYTILANRLHIEILPQFAVKFRSRTVPVPPTVVHFHCNSLVLQLFLRTIESPFGCSFRL